MNDPVRVPPFARPAAAHAQCAADPTQALRGLRTKPYSPPRPPVELDASADQYTFTNVCLPLLEREKRRRAKALAKAQARYNEAVEALTGRTKYVLALNKVMP